MAAYSYHHESAAAGKNGSSEFTPRQWQVVNVHDRGARFERSGNNPNCR